MSFANLKTHADLASRRSEAARLLQVSIDNETYLEGKMKNFKDPRKPDEVPPQYKTYAELVADNITQEQNAIKNLSDLKIPFDAGSQIAQFLSSIGKLVLFNASFPTIKADIMKRYNVKLLDVDFLKNYLNRFFTHLETSYGFTIDRETGMGKNIFSSVADAKATIPTTDGLKAGDRGVLTDLFDLVQTALRVVGYESASSLTETLRKVIEAMPTQADLNLLNKYDEPTKRQLLNELSSAFTETRCPTSAQVIKANNVIHDATKVGQFLIGSDELSQTGRDTFSVNTAAALSQLELQFRACGDSELGALALVRDSIRSGETLNQLGRQAGEAGNIALQIQEQELGDISRDIIGDLLGRVEGFDRAENEIIRRQEYEEDLADEVVSDAELRLFNDAVKTYIRAVDANGLDKNYSLTSEGLSDIINSGIGMSYNPFKDEDAEMMRVNFQTSFAARKLVNVINRTGRSIEELYQMIGGQSIEQRELEADADIWNEDNAVREYRGGDFNPEGRELLRGDDVGGAAQEGRRERREPEAPNYVPLETWRTIHRDLASKYSEASLIQLSRNTGALGVYEDGTFQINLPVNMTPELRRLLAQYERETQEYIAEMERQAREPPKSAEQLEQEAAFQRQQDEESRARLAEMRRREKELEGASAQQKVRQIIINSKIGKDEVKELVARVNALLRSNGLKGETISVAGKANMELIDLIASRIVLMSNSGIQTILEGRRQLPYPEFKSSKNADFGLGVNNQVHMRNMGRGMSKLPPMNPYDKKKFLETAEGREFMNLHPREKIMDRKFIEQHQDEEEGMGLYKMTRIPVRKGMVKKKKIGGGIAVQSTPTYAEFGKYAIHLPQLHNKNTLNIKYKSLGAIPTLKPITISDDFKDFIMETLERKSVNEKALKKLPTHEISYFERAVAGAGLLETFKMKRSNTDEEKKDLDRFNILRGELIAGNNSDKLVKELRSLIVKFLNTGRIHKAEGMNLLQELSAL